MGWMRRLLCLVVALSPFILTASGGATHQNSLCGMEHLAFTLPEVSAPMQSGAVGFGVHNTGRACRLALPISLTLLDSGGRPLKTTPRRSVLTIVAGNFGARAQATVVWAYTNYCGTYNPGQQPIRQVVRVAGIELRGSGSGASCYTPSLPLRVSVLFACPGARGPAIDAVTPRPLPLCFPGP
jgi:hypothetical protein